MADATKRMISLDDFKARSEAYFENCKKNDEPLTLSGIALAIGFASVQSLYDYSKDPDYKDVALRARLMVEHQYEKQLASGRGDAGVIFALKNTGHWKDKVEQDHTSSDGSMTPRDTSLAVLDALKRKHESE